MMAFSRSRLLVETIVGFMFSALTFMPAIGQSVLDRLSGFDQARLEAVGPWADEPANEALTREAAKLLFQINRIARSGSIEHLFAEEAQKNTASKQQGRWSSDDVGRLLSISGRPSKIDRIAVPSDLAKVLGFTQLYRVEVSSSEPTNDAETTIPSVVVMTGKLPSSWLAVGSDLGSQQTKATGVIVRVQNKTLPLLLAAPSMAWLPGPGNDVPGEWLALSEREFDLSLFDGVRQRDRDPLTSEDSAAFYPLLGLAPSLFLGDDSVAPQSPIQTPAAELLKRSSELVGRYIRIDVQTVRFTRVTVATPAIKSELGSDHYWQIDSLADLGDVVIKTKTKGDESATFENRYPISIVTRDLPPFLAQALELSHGPLENLDIAMFKTAVSVDGIYFRMWSYESDFMDQNGGGNQFGPLVIASQFRDIELPRVGSTHVSNVGWYVVAMTLGLIVLAIVVGLLGRGADTAKKLRQTQALPDRLDE